MGRVLVIEDDAKTAEFVAEALEQAGHTVDLAADRTAGETLADARFYDLLIVDRMLPGGDGLALVVKLREAGAQVPALFLSGLGSVKDKVEGLESGGDDYLAKPYALAELLARVAVLMRRADRSATHLVCADLELDLLSRTARWGDRVIELLPREFQILELLMRHRNQVVTRAMLLEEVWNYHFNPQPTSSTCTSAIFERRSTAGHPPLCWRR